MNKISGVYKITNTITGDFYIGSSKNIKRRWVQHKSPSQWTHRSNSRMYQAIAQYGLNNFKFEIIEETIELKEREQYWIDLLKPAYNNYNAKGYNTERRKEYQKEFRQSEKGKEYMKEYQKEWQNAHQEEMSAYNKEWYGFHRDEQLAKCKTYYSRLCFYEGEILTLRALSIRFGRQGIAHPTQKAKEYLLNEQYD